MGSVGALNHGATDRGNIESSHIILKVELLNVHGILAQITDFVSMLYVSWLGSMQILQFIEFILILTNSTLTLDYSLRGLVLGTATLVLILGSDSSIFSLFERGIVARGIAIDRVFAYCLDWIRLGICNLGLNSTQIVITVHQLIATVMQVSTLAL